MEKIRDLQTATGKHVKTKIADIQRLYSKWLWLVMAVYKPLFADAESRVAVEHLPERHGRSEFLRRRDARSPLGGYGCGKGNRAGGIP